MLRYALIPLLCLVLPQAAFADDPVIEDVTARQNGGSWSFSVTLSHPDSGWDHYADGWRVLDMDGNELGLRVLAHPHVDEQPFTRALSGVALPNGTTQVQIQARCNLDGWAAEAVVFDLP
ncbi:hypothetical protein [Tritonibacter scottomollicae]|uniref:hypothetical protein n=1 Tax=Tritonibacter scottomollicae TaxID=483013 RepID=UPI003AA994A7